MKGKAKCKALKEIRRQIAEQNDIPYAVSQCTYQGDCKGTCPKCEAELKYLERELAIRQGLGKAVAVAGISLSVCTSLTACSPVDTIKDFIENIGHEELAGDVQINPDYRLDGAIAAPETDEALIGETASPETTVTLEGDVAIPEDIEGGIIMEEDDDASEADVSDPNAGSDDDSDEDFGELAGDIAPVE